MYCCAKQASKHCGIAWLYKLIIKPYHKIAILMNKIQLLNTMLNVALAFNLLAGALQYPWWISIPIFSIIHAVIRLAFIREQAKHKPSQAMIAPPQIRQFASILTAIIGAILAYGIGFAGNLLLGKIT